MLPTELHARSDPSLYEAESSTDLVDARCTIGQHVWQLYNLSRKPCFLNKPVDIIEYADGSVINKIIGFADGVIVICAAKDRTDKIIDIDQGENRVSALENEKDFILNPIA